jgi:hypothetical protein
MKNWPAIIGSIMVFGVALIVVGGAVQLLAVALARVVGALLGFGS